VTKTTVYLPDDLKAVVKRLAGERQISEAEVIREAIRTLAASAARPRPRVGYISSGDGTLAERVDELLEGFGEL
jgi:Arc/MetJ-type ribon-helix-helix transcriptional regulator